LPTYPSQFAGAGRKGRAFDFSTARLVAARPYFSEETKRRGGGSEHREHGRHGEQANDYIFLPFEAGVNAAAEPTREATIAAFMVIDYLM
jgi:hypothetical protein